jgi:hypothetical protein
MWLFTLTVDQRLCHGEVPHGVVVRAPAAARVDSGEPGLDGDLGAELPWLLRAEVNPFAVRPVMVLDPASSSPAMACGAGLRLRASFLRDSRCGLCEAAHPIGAEATAGGRVPGISRVWFGNGLSERGTVQEHRVGGLRHLGCGPENHQR